MYAQVSRMRFRPGMQTQIVEQYKSIILPAFGRRKWFQGLWLLIGADDTILEITFWNAEATLTIPQAQAFFVQQQSTLQGLQQSVHGQFRVSNRTPQGFDPPDEEIVLADERHCKFYLPRRGNRIDLSADILCKQTILVVGVYNLLIRHGTV